MTGLNERIMRGKKAITLAKNKGLDTSQWEDELANLEALAKAEEVARRTRGLLDKQDWCLWKCSVFDGDVIVVCRGEISYGYPKGYPVYMEGELEKLFQSGTSDKTLRLIHEAKKLAGAKVTTNQQ